MDKSNNITNLKKGITGYNSKDVDKLIYYAKTLEKDKILSANTIKNQEIQITRLLTYNNRFKANKEYLKQKEMLKEQQQEIKELKNELNKKDLLINSLKNIKSKLEEELDRWKGLFDKMANAIDKILGRKKSKYVEDYEDLANSINYDYYEETKDKDDFEIEI